MLREVAVILGLSVLLTWLKQVYAMRLLLIIFIQPC